MTLEPTIPQLFAAQAAAAPEAIAVNGGGTPWTYRELEDRAGALARRLRQAGVGPETPVGVLVERSPEAVAALLAILQAGGSYVPLDAGHPAQRLAWMAHDAGLAHLVADPELLGRLPAPLVRSLRVVDVADDGDAAEAASPVEIAPENLAYVLYTSGSTGTPKGVAVPHRAVVRLVRGADFADLGPRQVFLQLAPLSFDASTLEIWAPLLNGGRLAVHPPGPPSLEQIADVLRREGVTTLWLTAGLFHQMVDEQLEALGGLAQLLAGGDVLSPAHVRRLIERFPRLRVINGYGPTENTTFSCCHTVSRLDTGARSVPIGRTIAGSTARVLGRGPRPQEEEQEGELFVGGRGLARGYHGRPALTAAAFVPDPVGEPGERLYRTGDRVRRLPDGALDFLGRVDLQVKLRGFRVEPGEIEAVMAEHPAVLRCAVVPRDDRGERRLVAYAVAAEGRPLEPRPLRTFLAARLPPHMVPAELVVVDQLPLTANGKVDRRALADRPLDPRRASPAPTTAPRNATEAALAALAAELLGVDQVQVDDDLLELGFHSLVATRFASRVRERFGAELPLVDVLTEPTVAALAERVGRGAAAAPAMRRRGDAEAPLSSAQQRIWLLSGLAGERLPYNFQAKLALRGRLDAAALHGALAALVARHEIFRTSFPDRGGEPMQVIHPPWRPSLPRVDLRGLRPRRARSEAARLLPRVYRRAFDLARLPLIDWTLFQLAEDDNLLLHVEHHLLHDGWSFNVFLAELAELYAAAAAGRTARLPELPIQFADFARWQQEWVETEEAQRQLDYWRRRLADGPPPLDLPTDRPRPPVQTFHGDSFRLRLPAPLAAGLRELAQGHGVTLFMTLFAAFATLLHRTSGQTDLGVGCGIANRRWRETEGLIGMVINTVTLRLAAAPETPFDRLLHEVRQVTAAAYSHQDVPFERVVEAVRPRRSAAQNPLFSVAFSVHDAPLPDLHMPGLELEATVGLPNGSAKFDLNVIGILPREQRVGLSAGGDETVTLIWEYSTDLFDPATARRMADHYRRLLAAAVENPELPLGRLPMIGPGERRQVLHSFPRAGGEVECEHTLAEAFAAVVAAHPERPALSAGDLVLTYAELDRRAERLAGRLRHLGVGRETAVALALERSPELVVAILATVKAGGFYVPLDPGFPAERLGWMLEDVAARVVVTRAALRGSLPAAAAVARLVDLDREEEQEEVVVEEDAAAGARPRTPVGPDDLAYVMFTSGSTGRPKGVTVPHRAVVRLACGRGVADLGPDEVLLQLAAPSFDASTFEVWGALLNGGRLAVAPPGTPTLEELARVLAGERVTTLWLTAGLFHQVVDERLDALAGLRQLLAGGDVLSPPHVARVLAELPACRLIDGYGPTENTTFTCCGPLVPMDATRTSVPIGRPIGGTRAYVLGPRLEPTAIGVPGEICAAGEGLARGYLGRPAATAAAFVPDPFGDGGRLYRTGDRGRWLPDGRLEFFGRMDRQVKLRGFRVEPAEVEAALTAHPAVRRSAVVVAGDGEDRRLVAYYVPAAGAPPAATELRRHLALTLPVPMIPSQLVPLAALPLSPTGKVDRGALPLPAAAADSGETDEPAPPLGEVEELLAEIWSELLGVPAPVASDDFFALGGHSLHATRLMHRLQEALAVDVSLWTLYEAPVLRDLARLVEERLIDQLGADDVCEGEGLRRPA